MYRAFCRTAKEVQLGRSVEASYLGAVGTVHADLTAVNVRAIQSRDRLLDRIVAAEGHEAEAPRPAVLAVVHNLGVHNLAELREGVLQIVIVELPGQVANVQPVGAVELGRTTHAGLALLADGTLGAGGQNLVHAHGTAVDVGAVNSLRRGDGLSGGTHGDETEATAAAIGVHHHIALLHVTVCGEHAAEILALGTPAQVADVQLDLMIRGRRVTLSHGADHELHALGRLVGHEPLHAETGGAQAVERGERGLSGGGRTGTICAGAGCLHAEASAGNHDGGRHSADGSHF
mmetsp:Transcript_362/g.621  ORF Transcript_362/g.621 Transcript_362/m.621 type:complete len:290 (+) Transcript_362:315-1184(+)